MNKLNSYIAMAIAMLLLQACGLKGDLYLENPESETTEPDETTEALPPMPEVETSIDDTGAGIAEDMETVEDLDTAEDDDVLGDAPIAP